MECPIDADPMEVSKDYYETVNKNIKAFLKDKTKVMKFSLENAKEDFRKFWALIGAKGNLSAALSEWDIAYNASELDNTQETRDNSTKKNQGEKLIHKLYWIVKKLPSYLNPKNI